MTQADEMKGYGNFHRNGAKAVEGVEGGGGTGSSLSQLRPETGQNNTIDFDFGQCKSRDACAVVVGGVTHGSAQGLFSHGIHQGNLRVWQATPRAIVLVASRITMASVCTPVAIGGWRSVSAGTNDVTK